MAFKFIVNQNPLQVEFEAGSIREGLSVLEGEEAALHAFFVTAAKLAHTHGGTGETTITGDTQADGTVTTETAAGGKQKRKRRTDAEIAADAAKVAAASAPAPLPVPGAAPAPPPPPLASAPPVVPAPATFAPPAPPAPAPVVAVAAPPVPPTTATAFVAAPLPDLQVPDFLKHPGAASATATAPQLPASLSPNVPLDIGKGAAEILAELKRRSAGNPTTEQQCADWVASFKTPDGTSNLILAPGAKFNEIADVLPFCKNAELAMLVTALGLTLPA